MVRNCFLKTAMEQLEEATEADWEREMKVTFIGEPGLDAGGAYKGILLNVVC